MSDGGGPSGSVGTAPMAPPPTEAVEQTVSYRERYDPPAASKKGHQSSEKELAGTTAREEKAVGGSA